MYIYTAPWKHATKTRISNGKNESTSGENSTSQFHKNWECTIVFWTVMASY